MPELRPDAVRQQIASANTDPVYLIAGDDEHEKSALALAFGEMVEEGLRAFNVERLYATDKAVTALLVTEAARTLPMMAPRRVVVVLSAEKMLAPKKGRGAVEADGDEEGSGDLEPLLEYLSDPSPTTSLVFVFSAADGAPDAIPLAKNLRITKALAKAGTLVLCTGLDGGKDPSRWLVERARAAGLEIDRQAVRGFPLAATIRGGARRRREAAPVCCRRGRISGPRRGHRRRPCITATTGRWSAARGRKPYRGPRELQKSRQRRRPVPDSGRSDTPSGRRRRAFSVPRGACRMSTRCSGRMWR